MTDLETRLTERLKADLEKPLLSPAILRKAVRGVLEEMREPSDEMLRAGCFRTCSKYDCVRAKACQSPTPRGPRAYEAMIDAALSPQEEG